VEPLLYMCNLKNTCHPHLRALATCIVRRCGCTNDLTIRHFKSHPEWVLRIKHKKEDICVRRPKRVCMGCVRTGPGCFLQPWQLVTCFTECVNAPCQPASAANSISEGHHIESTPNLCNLERVYLSLTHERECICNCR
jgi:hypothetical protein